MPACRAPSAGKACRTLASAPSRGGRLGRGPCSPVRRRCWAVRKWRHIPAHDMSCKPSLCAPAPGTARRLADVPAGSRPGWQLGLGGVGPRRRCGPRACRHERPPVLLSRVPGNARRALFHGSRSSARCDPPAMRDPPARPAPGRTARLFAPRRHYGNRARAGRHAGTPGHRKGRVHFPRRSASAKSPVNPTAWPITGACT